MSDSDWEVAYDWVASWPDRLDQLVKDCCDEFGIDNPDHLRAVISDAASAYNDPEFVAADLTKYRRSIHSFRIALLTVIELMRDEEGAHWLIDALARKADGPPDNGHQLDQQCDLFYEQLFGLEKIYAALPPKKGKVGRPPDIRVHVLINTLAGFWHSLPGKKFTQDWLIENGAHVPLTNGTEFVDKVVKVIAPEASEKMPFASRRAAAALKSGGSQSDRSRSFPK